MIDKLNNSEIKPSQITKPIQLLSAWLVGLILTNGSFLTSAYLLGSVNPISEWLVYASIANVPLFIIAIFLLQTKFRPEMQEDLFYSQYLDKKSNRVVEVNKIDAIEKQLRDISETIRDNGRKSKSNAIKFSRVKVSINDHLMKFNEIKGVVKKLGYTYSGAFGKVDSPKSKPPKDLTISFNEYLDFELVKPLLKSTVELGINNVSVFNPMEEPDNHDVFIGSYGLRGLAIDQGLLSRIEVMDMEDLTIQIRAEEKDKVSN